VSYAFHVRRKETALTRPPSKDEARRIAENIARRADLLGRAAPACQAERIPRDPVSSNSQAAKTISKAITPDRSKIIIEREDHVKYWTRHFSVTKDELARAIERVANSAAAVRKQLSAHALLNRSDRSQLQL
jgi:Protein of unknown function (DUF3606)